MCSLVQYLFLLIRLIKEGAAMRLQRMRMRMRTSAVMPY